MAVSTYVSRYIESLIDKKPGTVRQYASDLKQFAVWLDAQDTHDIQNVTTEDVIEYAEHLKQTDRNPVTIKRHLSSVRQLLLFYGVTITLTDDQQASVRKTVPLGRDDFISPADMQVLLASMQKPVQLPARDALIHRNLSIVLLMREHALRPKDIATLSMAQVNLAQGVIECNGETGDISLRISDGNAQHIRNYLQDIDELKRPRYHSNDPLFVAFNNRSQDYQFDYSKNQPKRLTVRSIQKMVTDEVRRAELRNISAKHLRNSCILDCVATGQPDDAICRSVFLTNELSLRRYKTYRASMDSLVYSKNKNEKP